MRKISYLVFLIVFLSVGNIKSQTFHRFQKEHGYPGGKMVFCEEKNDKFWYVLAGSNYKEGDLSNLVIGFFDGHQFFNFINDDIPIVLDRVEYIEAAWIDKSLFISVADKQMFIELNLETGDFTRIRDTEDEHSFLWADAQMESFAFLEDHGEQWVYKLFDGSQFTTIFATDKTQGRVSEFQLLPSYLVVKSETNDESVLSVYSSTGDLLTVFTEKKIEDFLQVDSRYYIRYFEECNDLLLFSFAGINDEIFLVLNEDLDLNYWSEKVKEGINPIRTNTKGEILCFSNEVSRSSKEKNLMNLPDRISGVDHRTVAFSKRKNQIHYGLGNTYYVYNQVTDFVTEVFEGEGIRAIKPYYNNEIIIGFQGKSPSITSEQKLEFIPLKEESMLGRFMGCMMLENGFWAIDERDVVYVSKDGEILERYFIGQPVNAFAHDERYLYLGTEPDKVIRVFDTETKEVEIIGEETERLFTYFLNVDADYIYVSNSIGAFAINKKTRKQVALDTTISSNASLLSENEVIFGFSNGDLHFYEKKEEELVLKSKAAFDSPIYMMEKDGSERLWVGTENGFYREQKALNRVFDPVFYSDFLQAEANRAAMYYDPIQGNMYCGTVEGLAIVDVEKLDDWQSEKLEIHLSEIEYADKSNGRVLLHHFQGNNKHITLPPQNNFIKVSFYSNSSTPSFITYQYRLNEGKWVSLASQSFFVSASLPKGEQVLEIRGLDYQGYITDNNIYVHINNQKFFFEKWWFRILAAFLVIGFFANWFRRIRLENKSLDVEVKKRTAQIEEDKRLIRNQAEEIRQVSQLKDQFFANVTHELKTPLTLIKSPLEQLMKKKVSEEESAMYLSLIKENSNLLEERVLELLDLSKVEAGQILAASEEFELSSLIHKNVTLFSNEATQKGVDLMIENQIAKVSVKMDKVRLQKIIHNLVHNAIKFSEEGDQVKVFAEVQDGQLLMEVEDTGIGISGDQYEKLFERFYQIPQEKELANPGSGIGLYMVQEFLKLMGGCIHVDSKKGKGTKFKVNVPFEKVVDVASSQKKSSLVNPKSGNQSSILVVEDNDGLRKYISTVLARRFHIYQAANGQEAIQLLEKHINIEMVCSDVMMPVMDGAELLKTVRMDERFRLKPFMFLTAKNDPAFESEMFRIGVDDYMTKPFDVDILTDRLQRLLDHYKSRMAESSREAEEEEIFEPSEFMIKLERVIVENLTHPTFSVDYIAELLEISSKTLLRRIKKEVGLGSKVYIKEVQLATARKLKTASPELTNKEIAEQVGYTDYKYFSRIFRERFGT